MSDAVSCRAADRNDTEQVKALWSCCFDDTPSFVDWYFDRYYQPEYTTGIFHNQKLAASAQVIPYQIQLRGATLDCGYVVGVDTAPEARNRGYARRLLQECLQMQRKQKQSISLLMPFEGQFYYRYGWPFCYFHQQIKIMPKELRCAAKPWGTIRQVALQDAVSELKRIYPIFTAAYEGWVKRTEHSWQLLMEDAALEQTVCYLIEQNGQAEGYCLWTEMKDCVFIREMAWCTENARAGLLHFLMEAVPENRQLWLELPDDDILAWQLAVSKTSVVRYPFLMARIVDVKQCLESLEYDKNLKVTFWMMVQDEFVSWNHSVFHVVIENGTASVQEDYTAEADILIAVEGLSQLVMGARSAEKLCRQNLLQASKDAVQMLEKIWPETSLYINEYY